MLSLTIPSYLYEEYQDDDDLQNFVAAYNGITQQYVDSFIALNLPIYTQDPISGPLLDWVAAGLYGIQRPTLSFSQSSSFGPFNTYQLNQIVINGQVTNTTSTFFPVTDDIFRRILTWNLFKGDGHVFNNVWLKKRVYRFLTGANGAPLIVDQTYPISVSYTSVSAITITITTGPDITLDMVQVLTAAIAQHVCQLPFMYTFTLVAV